MRLVRENEGYRLEGPDGDPLGWVVRDEARPGESGHRRWMAFLEDEDPVHGWFRTRVEAIASILETRRMAEAEEDLR